VPQNFQQIILFAWQWFNLVGITGKECFGGAEQRIAVPGHHKNSTLILRRLQIKTLLAQLAR